MPYLKALFGTIINLIKTQLTSANTRLIYLLSFSKTSMWIGNPITPKHKKPAPNKGTV